MQNTQEMDQARQIAADWHGGQASALYAFASSGQITDREDVRAEIRACERQADPVQRERLATLRAACERQADAQQRALLAELRQTPAPQVWSLDHTQPGALDADKAHITKTLERAARVLEFRPYLGFTAHLGQIITELAKVYHCPEGARAALQRHADQEMKRINGED